MECKSCGNYISIKMQYALLKNVCPYCSGEIVRSKNLSDNLVDVVAAVDKVRELVQQSSSDIDVVELVFDTLLDMFILYPREKVPEEKDMQQGSKTKLNTKRPQFALKTMSKVDNEEAIGTEEKELSDAEYQKRFDDELKSAYNELDKTDSQVYNDIPDVENVEQVRQHIIQSVNQANMGTEDRTLEVELRKVKSSSSLRAKRTTDSNLEISTGKNRTIQRIE